MSKQGSEPLLVTGDMNIHVDVVNDPDASRFLDLLDSMELVQHVKTRTHIHGHTLDLIITRETSILVENTSISDCCLSDYFSVLCNLPLRKPPLSVKEVSYRKLKGINIIRLRKIYGNPTCVAKKHWDMNWLILSCVMNPFALAC